eukprot:6184555-Pleurochrysis_carterae.AAC.1
MSAWQNWRLGQHASHVCAGRAAGLHLAAASRCQTPCCAESHDHPNLATPCLAKVERIMEVAAGPKAPHIIYMHFLRYADLVLKHDQANIVTATDAELNRARIQDELLSLEGQAITPQSAQIAPRTGKAQLRVPALICSFQQWITFWSSIRKLQNSLYSEGHPLVPVLNWAVNQIY